MSLYRLDNWIPMMSFNNMEAHLIVLQSPNGGFAPRHALMIRGQRQVLWNFVCIYLLQVAVLPLKLEEVQLSLSLPLFLSVPVPVSCHSPLSTTDP